MSKFQKIKKYFLSSLVLPSLLFLSSCSPLSKPITDVSNSPKIKLIKEQGYNIFQNEVKNELKEKSHNLNYLQDTFAFYNVTLDNNANNSYLSYDSWKKNQEIAFNFFLGINKDAFKKSVKKFGFEKKLEERVKEKKENLDEKNMINSLMIFLLEKHFYKDKQNLCFSPFISDNSVGVRVEYKMLENFFIKSPSEIIGEITSNGPVLKIQKNSGNSLFEFEYKFQDFNSSSAGIELSKNLYKGKASILLGYNNNNNNNNNNNEEDIPSGKFFGVKYIQKI